MYMRACMERMTPDFVKLSIGLRTPGLYEETEPYIMKVPQAFLSSFTSYLTRMCEMGRLPETDFEAAALAFFQPHLVIHFYRHLLGKSCRGMGHGAFQELDMAGLAKNICKYAVMVQKREDLAREIQKAFYIAKTGKPGVAVVVLPKDIQQAYGSGCYEQMANNRQGGGDDDNCDHYYIEETRTMDGWQIQKALDLLAHASRPLFLAGGGVRIAGADREMTELARRTGVPVVTTIMGKGAVPSADSLYIGNIGIHGSYAANCAVSGCDVLFAIGTRFNDRITGSPLRFAANATVVHINIDAGDLSRNIRAVVCELPLIICILNNGYLGNVRQWQEMFYDGHYSSTCMRYRKSCGKMCGHPQENTYVCPAYTPDFIRLAKSYGAHGIRVMKTEEIKDALISAKKHKKTPTVIEFIIERELNVMPVAAPGNALHEMILE